MDAKGRGPARHRRLHQLGLRGQVGDRGRGDRVHHRRAALRVGLHLRLELAAAAPAEDALGRTMDHRPGGIEDDIRSEEHTSELQSLMRISYAVFCLKKKKKKNNINK